MFAFVPETSGLDNSHNEFAIGFNPPKDIIVDDIIPKGNTSYKQSFGSLYKKGNTGFKVQIYKTNTKKVIDDLFDYSGKSTELTQYTQRFHTPDENTQYIVKTSRVTTYRQLLTCYKEAMMTEKIYSTQRNCVNGSDLVCKPIICIPVFKKYWRFVFVSTVASGIPVSKLLGFWGRTIHKVCKETMYADLTQGCDSLWRLGFVHNDLHPDNIIYDVKNRKVTFIDLETAVEVLPKVTAEYIETQNDSTVDCYVTFSVVMLTPALHMLRHSEQWLNEFTQKKKGECRVLHNIDSNFLPTVKEIIE